MNRPESPLLLGGIGPAGGRGDSRRRTFPESGGAGSPSDRSGGDAAAAHAHRPSPCSCSGTGRGVHTESFIWSGKWPLATATFNPMLGCSLVVRAQATMCSGVERPNTQHSQNTTTKKNRYNIRIQKKPVQLASKRTRGQIAFKQKHKWFPIHPRRNDHTTDTVAHGVHMLERRRAQTDIREKNCRNYGRYTGGRQPNNCNPARMQPTTITTQEISRQLRE